MSNRTCVIIVLVLWLGPMVALFLYTLVERGVSLWVVVGGTLALASAIVWAVRKKRRKAGENAPLLTYEEPPADFAEVEIRDTDTLPPVCVCCGSSTDRTRLVRLDSIDDHSNKYDMSRVNPALALFIVAKLAFIAVATAVFLFAKRLVGKARSYGRGVEFRLPQCKSCGKEPIFHRHIDFHGRLLLTQVHQSFAQTFRKDQSA